jgi:hypothetical protein
MCGTCTQSSRQVFKTFNTNKINELLVTTNILSDNFAARLQVVPGRLWLPGKQFYQTGQHHAQ